MFPVRSVYVFSAVEPGMVRERLDDLGRRYGEGEGWIVDDCVWAHLDSPPRWVDGFENEREDIESVLGAGLVLVAADVSSKIDGTREARSFALAILALGPGLAFDDDSRMGWTDTQLALDEPINGRRFFRSATN